MGDPESASHTQLSQLSGGMKGGYLRIEGHSVDAEEEKDGANKQIEDVYDAAGNKIVVTVKLSAKEAKKVIKELEKKLKDGKKKKTLSEEECWEIEDKLNELKEQLSKE